MRKEDSIPWQDKIVIEFCAGEKIPSSIFSPMATLVPGYHSPEEIDREIYYDDMRKRKMGGL